MRAIVKAPWVQVLVVGLILFAAADLALRITHSRSLVPMVLLLGALVVPTAYVTYFIGEAGFIDRVTHGGVTAAAVLTCFLIGGALGLSISGILEIQRFEALPAQGLVVIALIEEVSKLIAPVILFLLWQHRSEADGMLFGVAAGMGFAALETMGYGLAAYLDSQGNVNSMTGIVMLRGLLSPVGHAAWTGVVCATLWYERERTGRAWSWKVAGMFVVAVVLHALWNIGSFARPVVGIPAFMIVAGVSLALLVSRIRHARKIAKIQMQRPSIAKF
jgi:protease PrsW